LNVQVCTSVTAWISLLMYELMFDVDLGGVWARIQPFFFTLS